MAAEVLLIQLNETGLTDVNGWLAANPRFRVSALCAAPIAHGEKGEIIPHLVVAVEERETTDEA